MTNIVPRKAEDAVDQLIGRLAGLDGEEAAHAHEAALRHLMTHLIEKEGWLAEEFSQLARSLGAY